MVGNVFSNAGLVSQGMNAAQLEGNQVQESNIGLGELQRVRGEEAAQREATSSAPDNAHDIALAKAAQFHASGNYAGFNQAVSEAQAIPQQVGQLIAIGAVRGVDPADIESQVNQLMGSGKVFDPGSLKYKTSDDGHVWVSSTKDGQPQPPRDATQYVNMVGQHDKLQKGDVTVGGLGMPIGGGNPEATATRAGTIYIQNGPLAGKIVQQQDDIHGVVKDDSGAEHPVVLDPKTKQWSMPPGSNQNNSGISPKMNARLKDISDAILKHEGMSTIDPNIGGARTTTQVGSAKAALGGKLALANKNIDPQTISEIAVYGTPKTNPQTGESGVMYQGRLYKYQETGGQPPSAYSAQPTPVQTAPPQAPPQQPRLQPAPQPINTAQQQSSQVDQNVANLQKQASIKAMLGGKPTDNMESLMLQYDNIHGRGAAQKIVLGNMGNQNNNLAKGYARGGRVCAKGLA